MSTARAENLRPTLESVYFPLGGEGLSKIFADLDGKNIEQFRQEQEEIMKIQNPFVLEYLMESSQRNGVPNHSTNLFRFGASVMYLALHSKFGGTSAPFLSEKFVNYHKDSAIKRATSIYGISSRDYLLSQIQREHIQKVNMFRLLERDSFDTLVTNILGPEEELLKPDEEGLRQSVFSDPVISGFIASYFLFRSGYSDPANYSQP